MLNSCEGCGNPHANRKKFRDPRRPRDDAYVAKMICSYECEKRVMERLDLHSIIACLVTA